MNYEFRWINKVVWKPAVLFDVDYAIPERKDVLQYRYHTSIDVPEDFSIAWSEWEDVPWYRMEKK